MNDPVAAAFELVENFGQREDGSQVNVVVYTGNNPVTNALGAVVIRLISILTYAS